MGCAASVTVAPMELPGHTFSITAEESKRLDQGSSMRRMAPLTEHPGAPDRRLHDMYLNKLDRFLHDVETAPKILQRKVRRRRGTERVEEEEDWQNLMLC
ncbi:unnamed protein product [Effrenium voratum]|nr:unnamed protein product [Effrenium voratum]|mmetsp:Transcript_134643/g.319154  ORF Transcript_134643/g.319154 Transcript_134643/m.319154 type:complete len:100 (-) Transcript_134643:120-419(-)|eukprot:CAMPEP_0181439032 /NCGR_PEP_ID=MMETSP1110-20121109/22220_1 /TAXON_ID=174948 /ORGANISM="Symbiodinium sp., Strain CCMP421" /LENGTH=99 /DNA_ID=CAMNT_0023562747 /DNA_START=29 /DNA_END=328 /DNA_ORIENTATION=-